LTGLGVTAPAPKPTLASRAPGVAFIVKKALISALVALVLFSLMIGIRTEAGPAGQLVYWTRFDELAAVVAAVFVGSIVVELLRQWWGPVGTVRIVPPSVQSTLAVARRAIAPVLLIFTFLVPVIFYDQRYILDLGILVLTYVMLGWGLNVVVGLAGLLDLGYVAFYAVGAYSYALLATNFGLSFWVCLPLAGILAAFWGVLLGFPVLRLRGDYLAIVTLAFGEIIRLVIINWQSLTGGPNGVSGIPRPTFFGIPLTPGDDGLAARLGIEFSPTHRIVFLFYVILALALLTNWVTIRLRRLPIGRAWEALREDEVACRALGINTTTTKLTAFATGAMFGGFAGAFFATRQGFISPESFTFQESALVLAIVVLGGMGSQLGVALAALTMIGGFELFRGLDQYRMLVFGLAMVLLMIWRPRGLIGHRAPTVFLRHSHAISSDLVKEGHG
jgi:branched-chain amino acid transport system permease protein